MRLIDADALSYQLAKQACIDGQPRAIKRAKRIVDTQPTVDAVPVIRCKDCYFYGTFQHKHHCEKYDHTVKQDDYCAWAEPKEKDNDKTD